MREFWKKYKIWVSIALSLFFLTLFFVFVVSPLIRDIQEKSDEIQRKIIDREVDEEKIGKLAEMKSGSVIYEQEKSNLNVILDQDNSVDFIKKVELLADETGNKISLSIEDNLNNSSGTKEAKAPKKDKDPEDIKAGLPSNKYISMKIILEGNYENFVRFLYRLENLEYYINVISFDLSKEIARENNQATKTESLQEKEILVSSLQVIVYTK